jgi:type II restriction enzyme
MNSANRGEWSELYAIGYLLLNGGGFGADENARRDTSIFYKVLQVVDNPSGGLETIYTLENSEIQVTKDGIGIVTIKKENLAPSLDAFFKALVQESGSRAFSLPSGDALLKLLMRDRLSSSSSNIEDLHLILEDIETKIATTRRSFNIKSEIGSPATIFNASGSTNLTFKILGNPKPESFPSASPVKTNLHALVDKGYSLEFVEYDNSTFHQSLENIDSKLPDFLAELMLSYYLSSTTNLASLCHSTWSDEKQGNTLQISKIKKFLSAASMGLRANKIWSGYPEDFGGLLLVKENGDVLFYYLYNLQKFEDYLFKHLRFETPSASRHGFGQVYEYKGEARIKLNLQIRF